MTVLLAVVFTVVAFTVVRASKCQCGKNQGSSHQSEEFTNAQFHNLTKIGVIIRKLRKRLETNFMAVMVNMVFRLGQKALTRWRTHAGASNRRI